MWVVLYNEEEVKREGADDDADADADIPAATSRETDAFFFQMQNGEMNRGIFREEKRRRRIERSRRGDLRNCICSGMTSNGSAHEINNGEFK